MRTGVGITARVPQIEWIAENPDYPAEPKFVGKLVTSTGESQWFVSDQKIRRRPGDLRVVGRLLETRDDYVVQITEVFEDE